MNSKISNNSTAVPSTSRLIAQGRLSPASLCTCLTTMAAAVILLATPSPAPAQNVAADNFDSGSLDTSAGGWQVRNVCQAGGGYVNDSFVDHGNGKALRIQRGSFDTTPFGVPQAYGTGRAWLFRTNDYTDFYVAMDLVNWNDSTNQALVLLARGTGFDDAPLGIPGLGAVNGYVANYDNAQDGDTAGDRYGGELQINKVTSESPDTIAAAEVTLIVGHSYRMVFKGVGTILTAQLYDLEDLSTPIHTIMADDATSPYLSGKSGIVTFSRDDTIHPNRTDLTLDNYYSGPSDPNVDIAPAIRHPVAGTPQVATRTPSRRFTNFHPAATGISFTAKTYTAAQIDATATKLYLNGIDFSSTLAPLPANGSTVSFSTASGTLMANHTYAVQIELQDTTGTLKSTNTFWFDTFTDAGIDTAPFKTIECEDYNYSNGVYQLEPIPVSGYETNIGQLVNGYGVGYLDLPSSQGFTPYVLGTPEVDYHTLRTRVDVDNTAPWCDYRANDFVDTMQGIRQEIEDMNHPDGGPPFVGAGYVRPNDGPRQKYAVAGTPPYIGVPEYEVFRTQAGDWLNYTRPFVATNYYVFLRCGSYYAQDISLDLVTSDPTTTGQTTSPLGVFQVQNHLRWGHYRYEPLTLGGVPIVITNLAGTNTIRLTMNGVSPKHDRLVSLNYLLFVPTTGEAPVLTVAKSAAGGATVSWPLIPYVLLTSPSLTNPTWTPVISGVTQVGGKNVYEVASPAGSQYFKLVYP
ncbi:MAG TPA: hypothetical protein VJA21_26255 [Verrucomicrobiae bacterium]